MCGILGYHSQTRQHEKNESYFYEMLKLLQRRGPDKSNIANFGSLKLGHTRLSIIDLDSGGQPIYNEDETIAVVLNGEIYNFIELTKELNEKGHIFKTKSDTEVIVHLYEEYGENVFEKLNGMFAIILYDKNKDILLAARDRMGEKPLLYMMGQDSIVISSEIKSLTVYPGFDSSIDIEALYLYLNALYIPAPYTIYKGVRKLLPSHYLKYKNGNISIQKYWNPKIEIQWNAKETSIYEEFRHLLNVVVKDKLISDVPIGAFLSGGIDSSSIVAYMVANNNLPIKTFTVGFLDHTDERNFARLVAERFNTEHAEIFIKNDIENTFDKTMSYFDEPFADASAIPTYLISKEARKHVKVILSGDGGDELFSGYDGYVWQKYIRNGKIFSGFYRRINQQLIQKFGKGYLDCLYQKKHNSRAYLNWRTARTYFFKEEIDNLLKIPLERFSPDSFFLKNQWIHNNGEDPLTEAYNLDLNYYLPDDLLKKVDMASMMCGLETRAPYLDYRMVEFALRIPPHIKLKNDTTKYIVKNALRGILPEQILKRGKYGFGAPVGYWMKNQLKEIVYNRLSSGCRCETFFKRQSIDDTINSVLQTKGELKFGISSKLWMLFVFESWLQNYPFSIADR